MRNAITITPDDPAAFKLKLLDWAQQFREVVFLDSNDYPQKYSSFDWILAVDALTSIKTDYSNAFDKLAEYQQHTRDWLFGYLSYDLKNDVEDLFSANHDGLEFPELFFFQPKKIFICKNSEIALHYLLMCDDEFDQDQREINSITKAPVDVRPSNIKQRISKREYLEKVGRMLSRIARGDIYEANFCMEFFAEDAQIDPVQTYQKLNAISLPPFAAFLKLQDKFLLSASPERFIRKEGTKVISQPIKGTAKRSSDPEDDEMQKLQLQQNEKERSENIMIVDLVRNDLSRTAEKASVAVEELCGAYTFRQVHHLISTVVSQSQKTPVEIIRNAFPMGSMTGAPKISAMQIIEELEETRRGIYSGAIGYFTPEGDFDFNVVIRSICYNAANRYVSF
ncbi:MAG: anthranilate synthase component I family protein, partial [Flavobacterium sp.]